jgi:RNA polymerase sigma-70 factor (ECF subfamily)
LNLHEDTRRWVWSKRVGKRDSPAARERLRLDPIASPQHAGRGKRVRLGYIRIMNRATPENPASGTQPQAATRPADADWSLLMARSQEGDAASYRLLLISISPYLRALGHRFGFAGAELEDAVQEVLMTLHTIRHTYDPGRPFAPWLTAVARHRLLDRVRSRARRFSRETELTEAHETFAAVETNLPEAASDARRLRAAIAALPSGQRRAMEMLRLREMSLKEASAASGQTETALKVAAHRALHRLRKLLKED